MATYDFDKPKRKNSDYGGYELADLGSRLISALIDGFIVSLITGLLIGAGRGAGGVIGILIGLAYYWYCWTRQDGQTLGKRILHLRVIKADGTPISDSDAVLRFLGYHINTWVFMIGWIWLLFDSNRQGWHDKLVSTYVVRAD